MAHNIKGQLVEELDGVEFGLQLDEATDNNMEAHLIFFNTVIILKTCFVKISVQKQRLKTYSRLSIHLYLKII